MKLAGTSKRTLASLESEQTLRGLATIGYSNLENNASLIIGLPQLAVLLETGENPSSSYLHGTCP